MLDMLRGRWNFLLLAAVSVLLVGKVFYQETYGPYEVIGYNHTDRNIASFWIDDTWGGNSEAHRTGDGGGGGEVCCLEIAKHAKTLHIKVALGLTWDQFNKNLPNEIYETDIPVPELQSKHDGYIEFHFSPDRKIEAKWAVFPTTPHIPNATN